MYLLKVFGSNLFGIVLFPGKRFGLCGIKRPPSTAPFMAPKTLDPVVVRVRPTSRKTCKD